MIKYTTLLLASIFMTGCASFQSWQYVPKNTQEECSIYIIDHGIHTGIVVPGKEIEEKLPFLTKDFGSSKYYEVGWGDKGFYQAQKVTFGLTTKAMFWPTASVLHIVSVTDTPPKYFPDSKVLEFKVSKTGLNHIIAYIAKSFATDENNVVIKTKPGLYGKSYFYEGEGQYYFANTCNTWTAQTLEEGGAPMRTFFTLTSSSVMLQAKEAAKRYEKAKKELAMNIKK